MNPMKIGTATGTDKGRKNSAVHDQYDELNEYGLKWKPFKARGWCYVLLNSKINLYKFKGPGGRVFTAVMDFDSNGFTCYDLDGVEIPAGKPFTVSTKLGAVYSTSPGKLVKAAFQLERYKRQTTDDAGQARRR